MKKPIFILFILTTSLLICVSCSDDDPVAPAAKLASVTSVLDFGELCVGEKTTKTFSIYNPPSEMNDDPRVASGRVSLDSEDFVIVSGAGDYSLKPMEEHEVEVECTSTTTGQLTCVISVTGARNNVECSALGTSCQIVTFTYTRLVAGGDCDDTFNCDEGTGANGNDFIGNLWLQKNNESPIHMQGFHTSNLDSGEEEIFNATKTFRMEYGDKLKAYSTDTREDDPVGSEGMSEFSRTFVYPFPRSQSGFESCSHGTIAEGECFCWFLIHYGLTSSWGPYSAPESE